MLFRVESEIPPTVQIRLKVEINCFEHFNVLGLTKIPFKVENSWFTGEAELTTYHFEELLGTKLRALYQLHQDCPLMERWSGTQGQVSVPSLSLHPPFVNYLSLVSFILLKVIVLCANYYFHARE